MSNIYEVYQHRNPVTGEVFYVGSGKWHHQPSNRRATRFNKSHRPKKWLEVVEQCGLPIVEILADNLSKKEAVELEELITIEYKSLGYPLVNINIGDKHSEESRDKMSKSKIGKIMSQESRDKMSESQEKHIVIQYSKDGNFITQYPSLREAQRQTGVHNGNIRHCCRGTIKTAGGFIWKYAD
jgi:hypothetical protein